MPRITELTPAEIDRVANMFTSARTQGRTVRVAFDGGLMVKVGEGVWTEPLGVTTGHPDEHDEPALAETRAQTLLKAAAMLRRLNGPDPSQAEDYDSYDTSSVGEAKLWDGTEYAVDFLEGLAKVPEGKPSTAGPITT